MLPKYKDRFTYLTAVTSREFADEVQAMADTAGVKRHKFLVEALKLGVPMARYKIALDKVRADKGANAMQ